MKLCVFHTACWGSCFGGFALEQSWHTHLKRLSEGLNDHDMYLHACGHASAAR